MKLRDHQSALNCVKPQLDLTYRNGLDKQSCTCEIISKPTYILSLPPAIQILVALES